MINYVYGEQLYQEFVSFRDLFLKKAVARAQHVDAASDGRPVRPGCRSGRSKKLTAFRLKLINGL
ncbi:primary repressor of lytic functions [Escherichia coli]|nr:primary repressor of lytic functions [Escherichia coli]